LTDTLSAILRHSSPLYPIGRIYRGITEELRDVAPIFAKAVVFCRGLGGLFFRHYAALLSIPLSEAAAKKRIARQSDCRHVRDVTRRSSHKPWVWSWVRRTDFARESTSWASSSHSTSNAKLGLANTRMAMVSTTSSKCHVEKLELPALEERQAALARFRLLEGVSLKDARRCRVSSRQGRSQHAWRWHRAGKASGAYGNEISTSDLCIDCGFQRARKTRDRSRWPTDRQPTNDLGSNSRFEILRSNDL